jgi:unsaturated chondroitin disaccharide hydrolase
MESKSSSLVPAALRVRLGEVISEADLQLRSFVRDWPPTTAAPVFTVKGRWHRPDRLWTDWTPGFFAGAMWILARRTQDAYWRSTAETYTRRLAPRRFDRDVHDLGFIFLSTYDRWLDALEPSDPLVGHVVDTLVTAGTVQSFRWNDDGPHGFIYSFNGPQSLFIDVMMNVRLLFRARELGADEEVYRRAVEHCETSARYLVRSAGNDESGTLGAEDGAVAHEAIFNASPGRGEFRCLSTQQGYSPFTCWSRGLAWAIYGFAEAYRATREWDMLRTAERCASYWLRHTPKDGIPYWDIGAPRIPEEPVDASAAAIAACGLLILADGVEDPRRATSLKNAAVGIATTLSGDEYLAARHGEQGVLRHTVYHRPRNWGVDAATAWGDYFFLELVDRLLAS